MYEFMEFSDDDISPKQTTPDLIRAEAVFPPIPIRDFDYSAVRDSYEEGDLIGFGSTRKQAIDDLLRQESENGHN